MSLLPWRDAERRDPELETYRRRLQEILAKTDRSSRSATEPAGQNLIDLALELGASTLRRDPATHHAAPITEAELVNNIHVAIQTRAFVGAVEAAGQTARATAWIAVFGFLSAAAAIIAAIVAAAR